MDLNRLRGEARSWAQFVRGAIEILLLHPAIVAVAVGRPNNEAQIDHEFESPGFTAYMKEVRLQQLSPLTMDANSTFGQSPQARAWRNCCVETNRSYLVDAGAGPWAEAAHRVGIHASAALPIMGSHGEPTALLALYGELPGLFDSSTMGLFLQALQQAFTQAYVELGRPGNTRSVSIPSRCYHLQLLNSGAVQMVYQPIVNLKTGIPSAVEALARLDPRTGHLISPAAFLSDFGLHELTRLFVLGLRQSLQDLAHWDQLGIHLSLSLNLPPRC
jgi:hypothetical protein